MTTKHHHWLSFCLLAGAAIARADSSYLFVWAADADGEDSDFVAVIDADRASDTYGDVRTTLPVGLPASAHHTEHRMPEGGLLFVNGFRSGHSYVIDLGEPLEPGIAASFTTAHDFSYPHSFERLPNGNVLATFQNGRDGKRVTGGLVELDPLGAPLRSASAAHPDYPEIRPYSLAILARKDLVVSTTADMRIAPWSKPEELSNTLQFWRLSDLSLELTLEIPDGPKGFEGHDPAEVRLMPDGETLIVNTFSCGLYEVTDYESDAPVIRHLRSFPFVNSVGEARHCALPVMFGNYWIQTVPAINALVALDLSDTSDVRQTSVLNLGTGRWPHWIAREPDGDRIVVTGYADMENKLVMATFDESTGQLGIDQAFGNEGIVEFARRDWPHGDTGAAIPHGSVFSRP